MGTAIYRRVRLCPYVVNATQRRKNSVEKNWIKKRDQRLHTIVTVTIKPNCFSLLLIRAVLLAGSLHVGIFCDGIPGTRG